MGTTSRRDFLRLGAGATLGMAGLGGCNSLRQGLGMGAGGKRPNIVLILADDMGYSDIGCYGGEVHTPNLDRLAGGGTRFTQFYNSARCCPTRASLLTGLHPHQAGMGHMTFGPRDVEGYEGYLNDRCVTIAEALAAGGYRTAIAGKWHVGGEFNSRPEWMPLGRGFQHYLASGGYFNRKMGLDGEQITFDDENFYQTDAIGDYSAKWIKEFAANDDPFFVFTSFNAPHWPLHAYEEDIAKYRETYSIGWDKLRKKRRARMIDMGIIDPKWALTHRDEAVPPWEDEEHKEWQIERMAVYAAMVDRMDRAIGRILQQLEDSGVADNTLVLFLSDNGGCAESFPPKFREILPDNLKAIFPQETQDGRPVRLGDDPSYMPGPEDTFCTYGIPWANVSNTPFRLYKHWIHEGGIATPLIAYWPGVVGEGAMTHEPGHLIDIMATCIDISNVSYPTSFKGEEIQPMEGTSLMPVLTGRSNLPQRMLYWEHEGNKAVRDGKWKLVSKYPGGWELYDLEADRTEMNDLAEQHPDKVQRLVQLYNRWAERCKVVSWDVMKEKVSI